MKAMLKVTPCQPTIGKVQMILDEVFKFSRVVGTFPIGMDYSGISKYNLAKGVALYILVSGIIALSSYSVPHDDLLWSEEVRFIFQIVPLISFYLIHLVWLVVNRHLMKEIYEDLKDVEYQLWKSDIDWSYNPSWCLKYLGFTAMIVSRMCWETFYTGWKHVVLHTPHHITYPPLHCIISQYLALLQICESLLRKIRTLEESGTAIKLTDKVLGLCEKVNTLYEPQLFVYIFNIFIVILAVIYVKIIQGMTIYITTVTWILNFVCPLLLITLHSGYISQEVKKINKMLYRRLLFNLEDEMLYFHLVAKRDIVFSVGGFFNMENTLIFSMITTGMNYLVFLIQYM